MIFTRRKIQLVVEAGSKGTFTISDLRCTARIVAQGMVATGQAEIAVFGLTKSLMNLLSTLGQPIAPMYNYKIGVLAGDDVNGMSDVFHGWVTQAWADFQAMPQIPFYFQATPDGLPTVQRSPGGQSDYTTYSGPTDVSTIMAKLAGQAGLQFENNGVTTKLNNPYYYGSPMEQARQVARDADIAMTVELGKLVIAPLSASRQTDSNIVVSKETGMIASPGFTNGGVLVRAEFTRYVKMWSKFTVKSDVVTPANREWTLNQAVYLLESKVPRGKWYVDLYGISTEAIHPLFAQ